VTHGGTPRHVPVFYCPYCAEEDIRPHEGGHGQWLCTGCRRVWAVRFIGLAGAAAASTGTVGVAAEPGGAR
jgi:transposase-like protein